MPSTRPSTWTFPKARRPKVRPWEADELGVFLDSLGGHRLAPVFEVIAATGLRRGEALGLRWDDVDLERGVIVVRQQLLQVASEHARSPCPLLLRNPPTSGVRCAQNLQRRGASRGARQRDGRGVLEHRLRQDLERAAWGDEYAAHGLVFAREDGQPVPPEVVTKTFTELTAAAGLRRVRLHDLRHGAASLRLAAGVDIAVVSKQLGHSAIALTVDTYSHLLDGVGRQAAERAMALVPRTRRSQPEDPCDQGVTRAADGSRLRSQPGDKAAGHEGGPPGDRTLNPRIKSADHDVPFSGGE